MKKYVLFLDDSEERIVEVKKLFADRAKYVDFVRTANGAIQKLRQREYEVISLDHDLGGRAPGDRENRGLENSGMDVVRFLIRNPRHKTAIVVHSWNIPAAQEMVAILKKAGYKNVRHVPFGTNGKA